MTPEMRLPGRPSLSPTASQAPPSPPPTDQPGLDRHVARLREGARVFAGLTIRERIRLLVAMREGYTRVAAEVVEHSCRAKRIVLGTPLEGEEWALGPWSVLRHFRLLLDTLAALDRKERPPGAKLQRISDGRLALQVLPGSALDAVLFKGIRAEVHMRGGVGEAELYAGTKLYRQLPHPPGVVLILGGGNSASIPCHDVLTKLFNEGKVCLLKMHPINAYLGPLLEEAFAPAIERGFLRIAYGGAEEGGYLASHPGIDEIHLTGSHATHEAILWGEDRGRRAERKAARSPLHLKRITSQLGCVSPVLVVPGPYLESQLAFQAQELAGAMVHNAGCNCHTPRLLVLPRGWAQRDTFLRHFEAALAQAPLRMAYYPGSVERWEQLVEGRERVRTIGAPVGGMLPWTIVTGLRPDDRREPLFSTEAFGPVLGEVEIGSTDPMEFLQQAVGFVNERVWGTLCATLVVHPRTLADRHLGPGVDRAIAHLRYGAVGVNVWPALLQSLASPPWGAHPGSSMSDIQSGRGWVHNTFMLEEVEKSVVGQSVTAKLRPPYHPGHRTAHILLRRLSALERGPGWARLPGVLDAAFRG